MPSMSRRSASDSAQVLPALREDLRLIEGPVSPSGAPTWLLFDPVANRYFTFDLDGYQLLSLWAKATTPEELAQMIADVHGADVSAQTVAQFARTLEQSCLLVEPAEGWRGLAHRAELRKHGWIMWLVHNYLFVRVPLFRPQALLDWLAPYVAIFYSRSWLWLIASIGMTGLYLVSRQWMEFVSTFQHFYSLDGLIWYVLAIAVVKIFHEFGHACTAVRYRCRVPTMGVAFLVMVPMLYTDVTDAWKLTSRRQKLLIDGAGIIVELMIAALSLFLWAFLPDGPARSTAFVLASTSLFASLVINLSPLMKFDGYFILADLLRVPNLQERANSLGRWKLRNVLFGIKEPCPDNLSPQMRSGVIAYAWIVWLYRLVVFTGIALAVYHMFFKALGLVLFAVEIIWFVLKPIARELGQWWQRRKVIVRSPRSILPVTGLLVLLVLAVTPWSGRVAVPAVLEPEQQTRIFSSSPGRIEAILVSEGARVEKGQLLFRLSTPETEARLRQTEMQIALVKLRADRRVADAKDKVQSLALEQELASLNRRREGLQREIFELDVRAPFDGVLAELPPEISVGRWVGKDTEIALVASEGRIRARGFVSQDDLGRIEVGTAGTFSFDDARRRPVPVSVTSVAYAGSPSVDILELASVHGGPIAVEADRDQRLVPTNGVYSVAMSSGAQTSEVSHVTRGLVHLSGRRESFAAAAWRQVLKVLLQESGA